MSIMCTMSEVVMLVRHRHKLTLQGVPIKSDPPQHFVIISQTIRNSEAKILHYYHVNTDTETV